MLLILLFFQLFGILMFILSVLQELKTLVENLEKL